MYPADAVVSVRARPPPRMGELVPAGTEPTPGEGTSVHACTTPRPHPRDCHMRRLAAMAWATALAGMAATIPLQSRGACWCP